jgi:hypothetical protein
MTIPTGTSASGATTISTGTDSRGRRDAASAGLADRPKAFDVRIELVGGETLRFVTTGDPHAFYSAIIAGTAIASWDYVPATYTEGTDR